MNNDVSNSSEVFSYFEKVISKAPAREEALSITELHSIIRSPAYRGVCESIRALDPVENKTSIADLKTALPGFTASCHIPSRKRSQPRNGHFEHTLLIQADFDDSQHTDRLVKELIDDPHVRLVFRSPSNKVKALFKVTGPIETKREHELAFGAVRNHCLLTYGDHSDQYEPSKGPIDKAPSAVNSLCFVSYDPNAVLKDAEPLPWKGPEPVPRPGRKSKTSSETPSKKKKKRRAVTTAETRLDKVLVDAGIVVKRTVSGQACTAEEHGDGDVCVMDVHEIECPWHSEHSGDDIAAVFVRPCSAQPHFHCFHDHCSERTWSDFLRFCQDKTAGVMLEASGDSNSIALWLNEKESTLLKQIWDVWPGLFDDNGNPDFYDMDGRMMRVDMNRKRSVFATANAMRFWLGERFGFFRRTDKGETVQQTRVPDNLVNGALDLVQPFLPKLDTVFTHPVLRRDGTCAGMTGYYEDIRSFVFAEPETPEWDSLAPSPEAVEKAKDKIDKILGDFLFIDDASKANYYAYLLSFFIRPYLTGNAPMLAVTAAAPGAGKTKLCDIASYIWTGKECPKSQVDSNYNVEDTEMRKRLIATLMEAPENIVFDNVSGLFQNDALASALTTGFYKDRILGVSQNTEVRVRSIMAVTGNNLRIGGDLPRRVIHCHIDVDREKPEERDNFAIKELDAHVKTHRFEYMEALMTMVKAWQVNGCPRGSVVAGSYEEYASVMSGILENAGITGFAQKPEEKEPEILVAMRVFCDDVYTYHYEGDNSRRKSFTIKDVFPYASHTAEPVEGVDSECGEVLDEYLGNGNERSRRINLSKLLLRMSGRFFGDYRLEKVTSQRTKAWELTTKEDRVPSDGHYHNIR